MQSTEQLTKYNKIIRPYFLTLTQEGLNDIAALDQYLDRYIQDPLVMPFLCESFKQVDDLYICLNEPNQQILNVYLKVRFFSECLAQAVAFNLVDHFKSHDLMVLGEQARAYCHFAISNAKDYLNVSNLMTIVIMKLAIKAYATISERYGQQATSFYLPQEKDGVLVDISPDIITHHMLANANNSYNHLFAFATNPIMLNSLIKEKAFKGVVPRFTIFKSIVAPTPNVRIFFDANNTPYTNRVPQGTSPDKFFVTRTIAGTLKETSAHVLKFSLNPNLLSMILSNESVKAILKHKVKLIACSTYQSDAPKNTTSLDLNETFGDCFGLAALITHITAKEPNYKVQLQIDPLQFGRLQILISL